MKVKFIETTNKYAKELLDKEVDLTYDIKAYFSFDPIGCSFELRNGTWRTSEIKQILIDEISFRCFKISVITESSLYVFQKGELSDKKALTKDEKLGIAIATMI
jgi:hypothetical protein